MQRKNILGLIIVVIMILGLSGCGSNRRESEIIMTDECKAILDFLNCDYEVFENDKNGDKIITRFNDLTAEGKANGFYPLIIIPSDTLVESIGLDIENSGADNTDIVAYRQTILEAAKEIDVAALLSTRLDEYLGIYNNGYDIYGQFVQTEPPTDLSLYMLAYEPCAEVIIAKIPAKNPWELAAWIPMGGFNECPKPEEQVAIFQYWYEKYGAVPAVVTSDVWEMTLTKPPQTDEEAEALAQEHFAFCSDIVTQGAETIRVLASTLKNSTAWYFWWD